MTNEFLSRRWINSDFTIAEFLDRLRPDWLDDCGIGFCQLVPDGYGCFGLRDNELILFLRLSILRLLQDGGLPVRSLNHGKPDDGIYRGYEIFHGYGTDPEQIADAVIAEWVAAGSPLQVEWGNWWLARPDRLP